MLLNTLKIMLISIHNYIERGYDIKYCIYKRKGNEKLTGVLRRRVSLVGLAVGE